MKGGWQEAVSEKQKETRSRRRGGDICGKEHNLPSKLYNPVYTHMGKSNEEEKIQ